MFHRKSHRQNFYFQKAKLRPLHINQLTDEGFEFEYDEAVRRDPPKTCIYINESLTPENRDLFIKAKKKAKVKHYEFPGYTFKGQVRIRKNKVTDEIYIRCLEDIDLI